MMCRGLLVVSMMSALLLSCVAPIQFGKPCCFPPRIGWAVQPGEDLGHDVQAIALRELEHVPKKVLCRPGHGH